jgi:hypothetical protein
MEFGSQFVFASSEQDRTDVADDEMAVVRRFHKNDELDSAGRLCALFQFVLSLVFATSVDMSVAEERVQNYIFDGMAFSRRST